MSFWAVAPYMGINERTATHSSHWTRPWLSSLCHLTQTNVSSQSRLTFIIRTLYGLVYNPVMSKFTTQAFLISQYNYNFFNFTFLFLLFFFFNLAAFSKKKLNPDTSKLLSNKARSFLTFVCFGQDICQLTIQTFLYIHNPDISKFKTRTAVSSQATHV